MFKDDSIFDHIVRFFLLTIAAAEAAHLSIYLLDKSFKGCTILFGGFAAVLFLAYTGVLFIVRSKRGNQAEESKARKAFDTGEKLMCAGLVALILLQILMLVSGRSVYRGGDMTVETVNSFLNADGIYRVNPMTGAAYTTGIPKRLAILCLPTLYGVFCNLVGVNAAGFVYCAVPVVILLVGYAAFGALACSLFPDDRKKRLLFLLVVAMVLLTGNYAYGMDGFGFLSSGWRGVTIRNGILLPYTFALCLRKRYVLIPIVMFCEACIVWTLYGLGMCALVYVGMCVATAILKKLQHGRFEKEGR